MAVNVDDPTLPVGCATQPAPDVAFDDCVPVLNYGPIRNLYAFNSPFTATPTAAEIATRLGTTLKTDPQAGSLLIVEVGTSNATTAFEEYNGKQYAKPGDLEMSVTIKDTSDKNWEFARRTQKGGYTGYFYGVDANGNWFGGQNGIFGGKATLSLRGNIPTDKDALQTIAGTIKGRGYFDSKRIASPVPVV